MKNAPSATSSDLERARGLSRKLRPELGLEPSTASAPPGGGAFIRFRAAGITVSGAPAEATARLAFPRAPAADVPWDPFLDWCRAVAGAGTAFVLDMQGLIVSVRGGLSAEEAEGIGSRVMVALEQARKIQPDGATDPAVSIDYGDRRLSGFAVALKDRSFLTIGLIGPRTVDPEARVLIEQACRARE